MDLLDTIFDENERNALAVWRLGRIFMVGIIVRQLPDAQAWITVPVSRNAKRALQASRWPEYGGKNGGRYPPDSFGGNKARKVFRTGESRAEEV